MKKKDKKLGSVAIIGNFLPRQCGIATFTTDLANALSHTLGNGRVSVVAMDDIDGGYPYAKDVKFQVRDNRFKEYQRAADFLNVHNFDVAILQHEYGIYGGDYGSYVLRLVRNLNMPLIITLHTVLERPNSDQKKILEELSRYSAAMVVMSKRGVELLKDNYSVPEEKINLIHHGIHDVGFEDPCLHKDSLDVVNRKVILTFGLIGPSKGLEYVVEAMPDIVKKHPDVMYLILGTTHPHVLLREGEAYRQKLHQMVNRLGLKDHVRFKNQFVDLDYLSRYLSAADLYITPYLGEDQIVSGTLAYTIGAGKAVISTPYWYAKEMLADGRGSLVPFKDAKDIARVANELLGDDRKRNEMRKNAYLFGRDMVWDKVAEQYVQLAVKNVEHVPGVRSVETEAIEEMYNGDDFPEPQLNHLRLLTDSTGILRHSLYTVPNRRYGYSTKDNAMALIAVATYYSLYKDESVVSLIQTYLSFLNYAMDEKNKCFREHMSYSRQWIDDEPGNDCHGYAMWALGLTVKYAPNNSIRHMATSLFVDGLEEVESFDCPRVMSFILTAIHDYLEVYGGDASVRRLREVLAKKLFDMFEEYSDYEWPWPEETITTESAKIAQALLLAGQWIPNTKMYEKGIMLLHWLFEKQTKKDGHLAPIGNEGWYKRGKVMAKFEQRPLDVMTLLTASAQAFISGGDKRWFAEVRRCLNWFLGRNDLSMPLYNFKTAGCYDNLQSRGVNHNQGAEATSSWLISLLTMIELTRREELIELKGGAIDKKGEDGKKKVKGKGGK